MGIDEGYSGRFAGRRFAEVDRGELRKEDRGKGQDDDEKRLQVAHCSSFHNVKSYFKLRNEV